MTKQRTRQKTTARDLTVAKAASQLTQLVTAMRLAERNHTGILNALHPDFRMSGANLIHYLVLRNHDIRDVQEYLHQAGLSSLTNSESHTLYQVENVLAWLKKKTPAKKTTSTCDFRTATELRHHHAVHLLGEFQSQDRPHIMVTFSAEMTDDRKLVEDMLNAGMTVARINCAHDDETTWTKMIAVLQKAMAKTGRTSKIYMDLAGPKIRIRQIAAIDKKNNAELPVREGQSLILSGMMEDKGRVKKYKNKKTDTLYIEPASLTGMMKEGEHIFFDDGKFEAKVIDARADRTVVSVVRISAKKHILKPERGINLPDSEVTLLSLTEEDKRNLPFICRYADMIGYSFVSSPLDIEHLREEMRKLGLKKNPAIILKIERLSAIQHLPALLLNGMKDEAMGVMIARGDLAVEIGFERLSEIQEEILWICEAAHVPVIWATQVLETLNKTGYATRAEITDAASSVKAECVMLNKGKYIVKTIKTLDDILLRQAGHLHKKRYIMRPLGIARSFLET